jgi:hypothetical protein
MIHRASTAPGTMPLNLVAGPPDTQWYTTEDLGRGNLYFYCIATEKKQRAGCGMTNIFQGVKINFVFQSEVEVTPPSRSPSQ